MENEELIKAKEQEYIQYIQEHKNNVRKAWDELRANNTIMAFIFNKCESTRDLGMITYLIDHHDESKFSKEEFYPYRRYYYSVSEDEKKEAEEDYKAAEIHHYENNPHHWNYWADKHIQIPTYYLVEMICDWMAMSMKFNNKVSKWYEDNKDKIVFNEPKNREFIEELIRLL